MMRLPKSLPSLSASLLGGAIGVASLMQGGIAEAGHSHAVGGGGSVHISGSVHITGGGGVRVRAVGGGPAVVRGGVVIRHRGWYGGRWWYGGYGWWPPAYYYYYPEYVPSYYGSVYYPVQPGGPSVVAVRPHHEPLPRLGIGVLAGVTDVNDQRDSTDLGLLARFRLTPGLLIEAQVAKTRFENNERVDRRIGGSLIWEIGPHNALAPYLVAGGGVEQANVDTSFNTTMEFGEVGVGLRLALSRNLHITADVRAGARKPDSVLVDSNQPNDVSATARSVAPPAILTPSGTEDYTRAQVAAILMF